MNRIATLIFIAILTFVIVLFIQRPELLEEIWIWIIGLIGTILDAGRRLLDFFQNRLSPDKEAQAQTADGRIVAVTADNRVVSVTPAIPLADGTVTLPLVEPLPNAPIEPLPSAPTQPIPTTPGTIPNRIAIPGEAPHFDGMTITVLRYSDDKSTTLGLMYINGRFYCYTLEDTHREPKVKGETRIPAGIYELGFNVAETPLTKKYRERYEWFNFHLHIKKVPNYTGVYIHNGGRHNDSEGCILVSDSLARSNEDTVLTNSRKTFERLYKFLSKEINEGTRLRIVVQDESWFKEHYG